MAGRSTGAFSAFASGRAVPDTRVVVQAIEAAGRGSHAPDRTDGVAELRKRVSRALGSSDATSIWSASCPELPRSAELLIDGIRLGLDVPSSRTGEFALLAQRHAFPGRHGAQDAYKQTWRACTRRGLGHLLRVSYDPRFKRRRPPYAVISFAPPLIFDLEWRARSCIEPQVARAARARLRSLMAFAAYLDIDVRVIGVDVAVDVPTSLWALQALCTESRRVRPLPDYGRVTTVQSGSRSTWISLSAYDKRHQLGKKWGHELGHELTRIEVRRKDDLPLLADLVSLENPFDYVTTHYLEPTRDAPAGFKIAVRLARLVGLPALRGVLDRSQYASLLAATEIDPRNWFFHPRRVFSRSWRPVARRLLRDLEYA